MLIIKRKRGQTICIDNTIKILYFGCDQYGTAKFGIDAPRAVPVFRGEIQEQIELERQLRQTEENQNPEPL